MEDQSGFLPTWDKWAIGGAVIVGLAVATIATGGTFAAVAGAALAGAIGGGVTGDAIGATIGAITGGVDGALDGAADGFMSGAITGAVTSGFGMTVKAAQAGVDKFVNSMKKGIVDARGENGIKMLSGKGVKIGEKLYQFEVKVKGTFGDWRVFGNFDEKSGHIIFDMFAKGKH